MGLKVTSLEKVWEQTNSSCSGYSLRESAGRGGSGRGKWNGRRKEKNLEQVEERGMKRASGRGAKKGFGKSQKGVSIRKSNNKGQEQEQNPPQQRTLEDEVLREENTSKRPRAEGGHSEISSIPLKSSRELNARCDNVRSIRCRRRVEKDQPSEGEGTRETAESRTFLTPP